MLLVRFVTEFEILVGLIRLAGLDTFAAFTGGTVVLFVDGIVTIVGFAVVGGIVTKIGFAVVGGIVGFGFAKSTLLLKLPWLLVVSIGVIVIPDDKFRVLWLCNGCPSLARTCGINGCCLS